MNLVLFLTMLFLLAGRLPDYSNSDDGDEKDRTLRARLMFYGLLVYHLGLGAVRYLSQIYTQKFRIYQSLFIFATIYALSYICHDWVFRPDRRSYHAFDRRQEMFERWMDLELLIVYSSVLSAILYTIIRAFKAPPLVMLPVLISVDSKDYMETNQIMIELFTLVFTPTCMGSIYKSVFPGLKT